MFNDLFGNIQQQQEEIAKKLAEIIVEGEAGDGAVLVSASADMRIENITIDPGKIDMADREQIEDLLVVALNRALDLAREKANVETQKALQQMLPLGGPGGLPDIGGLFGK